jgi:hypothetical protein
VTIEADLFTTLGPLVSNRVYPETFVQPSGALPTWPSIRYDLISEVPMIMLCGDSGDDAPDTRVQIDGVDKTFKQARTLRTQIMAAMLLFDPPAVLENTFNEYDVETKTFRVSMDYIIYKSSQSGSP